MSSGNGPSAAESTQERDRREEDPHGHRRVMLPELRTAKSEETPRRRQRRGSTRRRARRATMSARASRCLSPVTTSASFVAAFHARNATSTVASSRTPSPPGMLDQRQTEAAPKNGSASVDHQSRSRCEARPSRAGSTTPLTANQPVGRPIAGRHQAEVQLRLKTVSAIRPHPHRHSDAIERLRTKNDLKA